MLFDQVVKYFNAATRQLTLFGGIVANGVVALGVNVLTQTQQVLTYVSGTPVAWDAALGTLALIAITDNVAYSIANPTNLVTGGIYRLTISNTSGAPNGGGTWDTIYKAATPIAAIATGFNRTFAFYYNGTNLVEMLPGTDVPN